MGAAEAAAALSNSGLNVKIKGVSGGNGAATCSSQSPEAGTIVEPGTIIAIDFTYSDADTRD